MLLSGIQDVLSACLEHLHFEWVKRKLVSIRTLRRVPSLGHLSWARKKGDEVLIQIKVPTQFGKDPLVYSADKITQQVR
jgi:hypothetical protein